MKYALHPSMAARRSGGHETVQRARRRSREARRSPRPEDAIRAIPLSECLPPGVTPTEFEEVFHRRNLLSIVERQLYERD